VVRLPRTSKFEILSSPFFDNATARCMVYGRLLKTLANSVPDIRSAGRIELTSGTTTALWREAGERRTYMHGHPSEQIERAVNATEQHSGPAPGDRRTYPCGVHFPDHDPKNLGERSNDPEPCPGTPDPTSGGTRLLRRLYR
jgi:hypothetical protein